MPGVSTFVNQPKHFLENVYRYIMEAPGVSKTFITHINIAEHQSSSLNSLITLFQNENLFSCFSKEAHVQKWSKISSKLLFSIWFFNRKTTVYLLFKLIIKNYHWIYCYVCYKKLFIVHNLLSLQHTILREIFMANFYWNWVKFLKIIWS